MTLLSCEDCGETDGVEIIQIADASGPHVADSGERYAAVCQSCKENYYGPLLNGGYENGNLDPDGL